MTTSREIDITPTSRKLIDKLVGLSAKDHPFSEELAQNVVAAFCDVSEPEEDHTISLILTDGTGRGGGVSRKPGNIRLNWRRLFETVPSIVLVGAADYTKPWMYVLAALLIWKEMKAHCALQLSAEHAIAMHAMWDNCDGRRRISEVDALEATNKKLSEYDFNPLSMANFIKLVDHLDQMECVELRTGDIWLREQVRKKFWSS